MARPGAVRISVEGLDELRRDLKQAGDKLEQRKLRTKLRKAAEIVASDARSRMPSLTGNARSSVKAGAATGAAYVQGGKADQPYYGWLDFGSRTPNKQVGPWRNSGTGPRGGRFIYPALEANSEELVEQVTKAVDEALTEENL
jgi:HK97 gp10 family phage protein